MKVYFLFQMARNNKGRYAPIGNKSGERGRSRENLSPGDIRHRIEERRERSDSSRHSRGSSKSGARFSENHGGARSSDDRADHKDERRDRSRSSQKSETAVTGPSTSKTAPAANSGRIPRKRHGDAGDKGESSSKNPRMADTKPEDLPDLREMPIVKRSDIDIIRRELKRDPTDDFEEGQIKKYGFMFFKVRERMVCFANPNGQVIIPPRYPPKHILENLKDPNVIKVGDIKDKFLLELLFKIKIRGHFDPIPLRKDIESLFEDDLDFDPSQPDQTAVDRIKTIREARDEVWFFWNFMLNETEYICLAEDTNLMPWIHMTIAKYSDLKGRMSGYRSSLEEDLIARKIDASPYFTTDLTLTAKLDSTIPTAFFHVQAINKNPVFNTEIQRTERRAELLITDVQCSYPLCKSADHLTSDCPVLNQSCEVCQHRGHSKIDHEHKDQIVLDRLFFLFAPSHTELGQIWMKEKANVDDWSKCYLRMEWTPKAGAITGLPKPVPIPMSVLLERKAQEDFKANMELVKKVAEQEAIVGAQEIEKQVLEQILEDKKKAAASTEKMEVDETSNVEKKSNLALAPLLSPEEEAEYDRLKQIRAKRAELQQYRDEEAAVLENEKKIAANKKILRDQAKASSDKIGANKKKKAEADRVEGLKKQKALKDQKEILPTTDINEYVEDPEAYVGKMLKDHETIADSITLLDTNPGGLSAIGITPKTVLTIKPKSSKTRSSKERSSTTSGPGTDPTTLDGASMPDEDEQMKDI